jgi:ABC-type glycerol-3-phosphate transport system permease component
MSEPLRITLIAVTVNLGGTLVIYSFMAFFLARFHWHGRGVLAVIMTIIIAELFWIVPASIGFDHSLMGTPASYSLCFGNWLVSAFSIVLFCQTVKGIPRQLEDSARLDGCGWLGIYWHAVLPLVRRDLGFIALLIIMATALPFWADSVTGEGWHEPFLPFFAILGLPTYDSLASMLAVSAIISLPVIAIFFIAKRHIRHAVDVGGMGSVLSPH